MSDPAATIAANLRRVRERIAAAADRSGRRAAEIQLVAVVKYVDANTARLLVDAGCRDLGESRPQQLWEKAEVLGDCDVNWHLVGHLQRNKIRRTLPLVSLIHSVDSEKLLSAIDRVAGEHRITADVLVEVNTSGDEAKHGAAPGDVQPLLAAASALRHIRIHGLMTMAALEGGTEVARANFAQLRELRDRLQPVCPANATLAELSMGMSRDFEVAIEEGATIVRVGSSLFEGLA